MHAYTAVTRYLRKYKNQFYKIPVSVRSIQYLLCTYLYSAIYNIKIIITEHNNLKHMT